MSLDLNYEDIENYSREDRLRVNRNSKRTKNNFSGLKEQFDNAVEEVSERAFDKVVDRAKIDWLPPVDTFDDLATTYPDATEGQTSMVRDTGKIYRMTNGVWMEIQDIDPTAINEVDTRFGNELAHVVRVNVDRTFYNNLSVHQRPRPMITILDDDTRSQLYSKIYPLIKELNVPITSAAITGQIGQNGFINLPQYREMRDTGLVEFVSHTVTHRNLTNLGEEEVVKELAESKKWITDNGGNPDYFVPPFGGVNDDIRSIIRQYYKASYQTISSGYVLTPPLYSYAIRRSDFDVTVVPLADQFKRLDETLARNGWIIINTHSQYPSFNESDLRGLINYARSIGLEFVTIGEGMKHFGNILDIDSTPNSPNYSVIDATGRMHGSLDSRYFIIDPSNVRPETPADFYKFREGLTVCHFTISLAAEYGWMGAGVLQTHKTRTDYTYQRYLTYRNYTEFHRFWDGGVWSEFINVSGNDRNSTSGRHGMDTTYLPIGHCVYDTTLQKPTWWSGSRWFDATGATV